MLCYQSVLYHTVISNQLIVGNEVTGKEEVVIQILSGGDEYEGILHERSRINQK